MTLKRVTRTRGMRGKPKCNVCGADIKELFIKGYAVYCKKSSRGVNYYCAGCKADLFEGVKLRDEV